MEQRDKPRRRVATLGVRRKVAGEATPSDQLALDDRPLSIVPSRDSKWLFITLPYEMWIVHAKTLRLERSLEFGFFEPSVAEGTKGELWIGGHHLHHGGSFTGKFSKVGSKLSGFVGRISLLRPDLLCGVGPQGEILLSIESSDSSESEAIQTLHRRQVSSRSVFDVVATPDERALFADGSSSTWIIDPTHPTGYTQLRLRQTSVGEHPSEAILKVGLSSKGRCLLAAADGAVAWTTVHGRLDQERFPITEDGQAKPLALAADERWLYVLRSRGRLQRFLIEQPPRPKKPRKDNNAGFRRKPEPEFIPLPLAQESRLQHHAECMTLLDDSSNCDAPSSDAGSDTAIPSSVLFFGGSHADHQLGRLWKVQPETLDWSNLSLKKRLLVEEPELSAPVVPNFVATKSKLQGEPLSKLGVDAVIGGETKYFLTQPSGTLLDRTFVAGPIEDPKGGDTVLLPAMLRFAEGTARPALLMLPGVADADKEIVAPSWLVWGDDPRGWMLLETPQIRGQRWSRTTIFPMQPALSGPLPELPGYRSPIPKRWVDPELFSALALECKKLLKVLW